MKKSKLTFMSLFLCFAFSVALFSNEGANADKKDDEKQVVIENVKDSKDEVLESTPKTNIQENQKKEEENKAELEKSDEKKEEVSDAKDEPAKSDEKKEAEKKEVEEKDEKKVVDLPEFASIQVNGLSVGKGSRWYFEEYDEQGNMIGSVSYDRRKMLEQSSIEYSDGKKVAATFTEPTMIVKVKYNRNGVEIAREEFENEKGKIGKPLNSSSGVYDDSENLLEETKMENGIPKRHVYTYNGKEKATETVYENEMQTLFIEYGEGKKTVHIFNGGEEVAVFDEEIE